MLIYFLLAVSGFESYISTNSQNLHVTAEGFLKRFFGLDKDLHVQLWIQGQWRDENISARLFYDTQQRFSHQLPVKQYGYVPGQNGGGILTQFIICYWY